MRLPLPVRIERHQLGPRVRVGGRRIHECHAGLALLLAGGLVWALGVEVPRWPLLSVIGIAAWLVVKDWRDLFPSRRDTAAWRIGVHRPRAELRAERRGDWLPRASGVLVAAVGLTNLASALTPDLRWRGRLLATVEPVQAMPVFHALALPAGMALLVLAFYLARRRRRAWRWTIAVLAALGAINLLKGLDIEEALAGWALAGLLLWGGDAFHVRHERRELRTVATAAPAVLLLAFGIALAAVWASWRATTPAVTWPRALREAGDLLLLSPGPLRFDEPFAWVPTGVALISIGSLLAMAYLVFRPLAAPRELPGADARLAAVQLVRRHGADTLSFFKLRQDLHHFIATDRRAFLSYRVEGGVLLIAGDPVGPDAALPSLLRELAAFAEARGLRLGGLGASERLLPLYRQAGLRSLYVGDEAIVDTRAFSLEGRPIRKVRQSVTRLARAGYSATAQTLGSLTPDELGALEALSDRWRGRAAERGFSMSMDSLRGAHQAESLIVIARDADGDARGFLQFVPSYGRPAASLSFMRRDRETPNGLTEFMVVRSIELLRELDVEEISLNFASFARCMHSPTRARDRLLSRLLALLNPYFQIESLYRFNVKFLPRWEPRYLLYEGGLGLPRAALATMWAEGQLPKPRRTPVPMLLRR